MPADSSPESQPEAQRPPPLTTQEIAAVIDGFIRLQVKLIPSKHFWRRGRRRNITVNDAVWILTNGQVSGEPEWNKKFGDWTYGVRGTDVEGEDTILRIGILPDRSAIVLVTAYEPSK